MEAIHLTSKTKIFFFNGKTLTRIPATRKMWKLEMNVSIQKNTKIFYNVTQSKPEEKITTAETKHHWKNTIEMVESASDIKMMENFVLPYSYQTKNHKDAGKKMK